ADAGVQQRADRADGLFLVAADAVAHFGGALPEVVVGVRGDAHAEVADARDLLAIERDRVRDYPAQVLDRRFLRHLGEELQHRRLDRAHAQLFLRGGAQQLDELLARQALIVVEARPAGLRAARRPQPRFLRRAVGLREKSRDAEPLVSLALAA